MPSSRFFPAVRTGLTVLLVLLLLSSGCTDILEGKQDSAPVSGTTGDLRAYFLDVGQGDSSVILFKDKVILIDAGEVDYGDTVVRDLQKLGVEKIDLLVATHPHSDHIGGMQAVFARFPVEKVLDSATPSSSSLYEKFLDTVDRKNIPYMAAEAGQTIEIDPSLRILVLSPPKGGLGDDINTNSIVLRISYGTVNLLYAGDATSAAESVMLKTGYAMDAQVLKVGHHGSSGSSNAAFLARVDPDVAVISLARDNPYGHPHKETLERLANAGPVVYRTDRDGTILVMSDGTSFSVMTQKDEPGIWSPAAPSTPAGTPSPGTPTTTQAPSPATPPPGITVPVTIPTIPPDLTVPVPSLTLPPVQVGNSSFIRISAVQFDAPGDDRQNLNGEWVRLTNRGDGPVLVAGWTLTDKTGTEPFTFPAIVILPEESVTVYVGSGTMNSSAVFMGRTTPLFGNSGDFAILRDGSGKIIDKKSE
ncbi:MAG: MBL fold metallo-hydrolase [Methanomicrobiales archaeon]|nr:MBL fold metallo-hydrolase [Methanomicrobiales archaeon]